MPRSNSEPKTRRTAPAAPPTSKGRHTRQRIIDCALKLFAERGYAGVTVVDITEEAGLSPGAFYRYFDDRHALTVSLLEELTAAIFQETRSRVETEDPIDSVYASTLRYFEFYQRNSALFGVLVELSQSDPTIARLWESSRAAFYARIARALQRAVDSGRARKDIDPQLAAELLGSMTEFYAFQRFVLRSSAVQDIELTKAANAITQMWRSGVSP